MYFLENHFENVFWHVVLHSVGGLGFCVCVCVSTTFSHIYVYVCRIASLARSPVGCGIICCIWTENAFESSGDDGQFMGGQCKPPAVRTKRIPRGVSKCTALTMLHPFWKTTARTHKNLYLFRMLSVESRGGAFGVGACFACLCDVCVCVPDQQIPTSALHPLHPIRKHKYKMVVIASSVVRE